MILPCPPELATELRRLANGYQVSQAIHVAATARELGFPELEVEGLAGIFGSREMAGDVRARIAADVAEVSRDPELRQRLQAGGQNVLGGSAQEFSEAIVRQGAWVSELANASTSKTPISRHDQGSSVR